MAKKFYVYSTLAASVDYAFHIPGGGDLPIMEHKVTVKGGAGVANSHLVTPKGVVTEISEQDAARLKEHPVFQIHQKNGFVEISSSSVDPDKAARDMTAKDNSAPVTPGDLPKDAQPTMGDSDDPLNTDGSSAKK